MPKFCENCGAALSPGAKFCKGCGAKVGEIAPPVGDVPLRVPPPQYARPPAPPQPLPQKPKQRRPLLITGGLLLLPLIVILLVWLGGGDGGDNPPGGNYRPDWTTASPGISSPAHTPAPTPYSFDQDGLFPSAVYARDPADWPVYPGGAWTIPNFDAVVDADFAVGYPATDTWAIYIFMCGSDLETYAGCASEDIYEILSVDLPDNVTVVVEAGGAMEWAIPFTPNTNTRFIIKNRQIMIVEENPVANMADKDTLASFLRFCRNNYPADHKMVIFWDHGGGSLWGVNLDEYYPGDTLTLAEIRAAFEETGSVSMSDPEYDVIGFDACLMATVDVAATFRGIGRYLLASEEVEPGIGWEYRGMFNALAQNPGISGARLGRAICDAYEAACLAIGFEQYTLSLVDLARIDELLAAYDAVGSEALVAAALDWAALGDFGRAAIAAENYGGNTPQSGYSNFVDLGDFVRLSGESLLPRSGQWLLNALDDCVIYQAKGVDRWQAGGLSCYFSYNGDVYGLSMFSFLAVSRGFGHFTEYAVNGELSDAGLAYANMIYRRMTAEPEAQPEIAVRALPNAADFGLAGHALTFDGNVARLELGPQAASTLVSVRRLTFFAPLYLFPDDPSMMGLGCSNLVTADWEKGVFSIDFAEETTTVIGLADGRENSLTLNEPHIVQYAAGDGYGLYLAPIYLNGELWDLHMRLGDDDPFNVYDRGVAGRNYTILGAARRDELNRPVSKTLRPLEEGDIIEIVSVNYIYDDGGRKDHVFSHRTYYDENFRVTQWQGDPYGINGSGYLGIAFLMTDVKGRTYLSNMYYYFCDTRGYYMTEGGPFEFWLDDSGEPVQLYMDYYQPPPREVEYRGNPIWFGNIEDWIEEQLQQNAGNAD